MVTDVGILSGVVVSVGAAGGLMYRGFKAAVRDVVREEVPAAVEQCLNSRPVTNGWGVQALKKIADELGVDLPPPGHG